MQSRNDSGSLGKLRNFFLRMRVGEGETRLGEETTFSGKTRSLSGLFMRDAILQIFSHERGQMLSETSVGDTSANWTIVLQGSTLSFGQPFTKRLLTISRHLPLTKETKLSRNFSVRKGMGIN